MAMKRNPLVTAMNEGIAKSKRNVKLFRESTANLLSVKSTLRAKYAWAFDKLDDMGESDGIWFDCSWSSLYDKPSISISMMHLESFKDKVLTDLLYNLCSFGDPEVSEYAEALNKDFRFKFEDVNIIVRAYVKSDSPTCRKIKIGTKMVEEATYKIVCS